MTTELTPPSTENRLSRVAREARRRRTLKVLDEQSLAIEARDVVIRTLRQLEHHSERLPGIVAAVEAEHPRVTPERVKAAIVSLLNRGILEWTGDGRVRLVQG